MIHHCKDKSETMESIYANILHHLSNETTFAGWNLALSSKKYVHNKFKCTEVKPPKIYPFNLDNKNRDMRHIDLLIRLFHGLKEIEGHSTKKFDWKTKNIGTWLVKTQFLFKSNCLGEENNFLDKKLDEFFMIEEDIVSLPDVAHLFSIKDKDVLLDSSFREQSFKKCFETIHIENSSTNGFPCLKPIQEDCLDYCKWHHNFVKTRNIDDFLTLMKLGMPQRKWLTNPVPQSETNLAFQLFGNDSIQTQTKSMKSSVPAIVHCKRRDLGFFGEAASEMSEPTCSNFFPTPTDVGICMTENMNIREIMHDHDKYDVLMESTLQEPNSKMNGGTLWSEKTYILSTQMAPEPQRPFDIGHCKSKNCHLDEIRMQVHSNEDFGNFLAEPYFVKDTPSVPLKRGMEYYFDIIPVGRRSSNDLKSLDLNERNCLTEDEISNQSLFLKYTERNCKYECHISKAKEICRCIPWDFMEKRRNFVEDCDVFGRECFFNTMKEVAGAEIELCPQCKQACDYTLFQKKMIKSNKLTIGEVSDFVTENYALLMNATHKDPALFNFLRSISNSESKSYEEWAQMQFEHSSLIVVHLRIAKPEIDIVDVTYSVWDKFANFGGNFGIFAEITGASLLGMMNFIILLLKYASTKIILICKNRLAKLKEKRKRMNLKNKVVPKMENSKNKLAKHSDKNGKNISKTAIKETV